MEKKSLEQKDAFFQKYVFWFSDKSQATDLQLEWKIQLLGVYQAPRHIVALMQV